VRIAFVDPTWTFRGELIRLPRIGYFALTLPVLAAQVPPGHSIDLIYEKCRELPLDGRYDLVFFTTMGPNLTRAIELSKRLRAQGTITVVGGWTVFAYPHLAAEHFDAVVFGEGEGVLPQLIADVQEGRLEPCYESYAPDLENIPRPRYDLIDPSVLGGVVPVESSRSCRNHCDFCAVAEFTRNQYRTLPVERVLANVEYARRRFSRRYFYFTDPNFGLEREHALAVMEGLARMRVHWWASVDVRILHDDEFLRLARRSGCLTLQVGFETPHRDRLQSVGKQFAAKADYGAAVANSLRWGVPVTALMMLGFDGDDAACFGQIRDFLDRHHLSVLVLHVLTPLPGTRFYAKLVAEGRLLREPLVDGDGHHLHFRPLALGEDELVEGFHALQREIYSIPSIVRRFCHRDLLRNLSAHLLLLYTNLVHHRRVAKLGLPAGMS